MNVHQFSRYMYVCTIVYADLLLEEKTSGESPAITAADSFLYDIYRYIYVCMIYYVFCRIVPADLQNSPRFI